MPVVIVAWVLFVVLAIRWFVVEPFRIPSGAMIPTLLSGDHILVNKYTYGIRLPFVHTQIISFGQPKRGDVVVFRYPKDTSVAFIKRIVGLPGDRLEYRNKRLYINGQIVDRKLLPADTDGSLPGHDIFAETLGEHAFQTLQRKGAHSVAWNYVVPTGHYFTLGDNRDNSRDSRFWGPLPEANLIGRAFLVWWNSELPDRSGVSIQ